MVTEFYNVIKSIDASKLTTDDLEDLLRLFMIVQNSSVRNHLAFIFGDAKFDKAIPSILDKIFEEDLINNNGSLVYSLGGFDMRPYLLQLVNIIINHHYEARLMAFDIVCDFATSFPVDLKQQALRILEDHRVGMLASSPEAGENSPLHFVQKTLELLKNA